MDPNYLTKLDAKPELEADPFRAIYDGSNPIYAHRLKKGRGVVFAYRWFTKGNPHVTDSELFEKLTIWISNPPYTKTDKSRKIDTRYIPKAFEN